MTDIGDLVRFGNYSGAFPSVTIGAFKNLAGADTNPTAVTLTVQKPDGTHLVYGWPSAGINGTLTNESAGRFYFDVAIDQAGRWRYRLVGTGAVVAAAEDALVVVRSTVTTP